MDETPKELRRQAEHCRDLASGQFDERLRIILNDTAVEFDRRAGEIEAMLPRSWNPQ